MSSQTTIRLVPSSYSVSNATYVTVTNPSYMYDNTDDTTNYATTRGRNGNRAQSHYVFINGFNFSAIPEKAYVTNFEIKIKAYRSSNQRTGIGTTYDYRIRLSSSASNSDTIENTQLSDTLTTSSSGQVYTIPTGDLTWDDITGYGNNFSMIIPLASTNGSYPYVYIYGVEIEVTYMTPCYVTVHTYYTNQFEGHIYEKTIGGENLCTFYGNSDIGNYYSGPIKYNTKIIIHYTGILHDVALEGMNQKVILSQTNISLNEHYCEINNITNDINIYIFDGYSITLESEVTYIGYNNCNAFSTDISNIYIAIPSNNVYTEWSGNFTGCILKDNNIDVSESPSCSWNSLGGQYIINNIREDHVLVISPPSTENPIYIKVNDQWKEALNIWCKISGTWKEVNSAWKKINNQWQEQDDRSAIFDPNALYIK